METHDVKPGLCVIEECMCSQAVEAKEKVDIGEDSVIQASVTFQCFFRYYAKLAGMTVRILSSLCVFCVTCCMLIYPHMIHSLVSAGVAYCCIEWSLLCAK